MTRVVCFAHCTSINGKTQLPGMQITLPLSQSLTLTARPGVAPGNGSIHKLLLYYRPHNMGLRLRHTSLFLTYVLAPLCAISNFNYEQVNPRNSPATMLLHGRLSFRKPVLPSPSSGLVHRAFPIASLWPVQLLSLIEKKPVCVQHYFRAAGTAASLSSNCRSRHQ